MKSPCYDVEKKLDCPRRHSGCAVDCPDWATYVKARNAEYSEKRHAYDVVYVLSEGKWKRDTNMSRKRIGDRSRKRKS